MIKNYFSYTFRVYEGVTPEGKLFGYCEVEAIADNEQEALKRAKEVYNRPKHTYEVMRVTNFQLVEHDKK